MQLTDWLASWLIRSGKMSRSSRRRAQSRWQRSGQIPAIEALEPRTLPAVFTVTSLADTIANDGQTTLREAIQSANGDSAADTIQFASALTASGPATIALSGNSLDIRTDMSIAGPGADRLAIDGNRMSRILTISDNDFAVMKTVVVSGLTMTNGAATNGVGGGIYNSENLTLLQAVISNNVASGGGGGGLYNERGSLAIRQSTISGNSTTNGAGGGICSYQATGTVAIVQSTISGNSTARGGGAGVRIGGRYSSPGAVIISQSTISGNTSTTGHAGGLDVYRFSSLVLSQSTIVRNSAQSSHGGVSIDDLSKTTISNTIIAGNTLLSGAADDLRGNGTLSAASRNNLIGNPNTAGGLTNGVNGNIVGNGSGGVRDAATVVNLNLLDNGGLVKTHAFVSGSPAINAGSNSLIPADTLDRDADGNTTESDPFDERGTGFSRIAGGTVDIGAFEQNGAILPLIQVVSDTPSVNENGANNLSFTFSRDTTSGPLTVNFGLSGTATSGTDYTAVANSVTFLDGGRFATITVDPTADSRGEMDESVIVNLLGGTGYQVGLPKSATGNIRNDDASVAIAATSATRFEADSGTTSFTFTVNRSVDSSDAASVDYAVTGSGVSPANSADFGGSMPAGETLTFAAGESTKTITINVSGDTTLEDNEGFTLTLSNAVNVGIGTATATGTIKNNDSQLSIIGLRSQVNEGQSGTTPFTFTVTRDGSLSETATVSYAVTGYTRPIPGYASNPPIVDVADFGGTFPSGTVTFGPTETSKVITVFATGDTLAEKNEVFAVRLSNVVGAQLAAGTIATGGITSETWGVIRNDDNSISIQVEPVGTDEGTGTDNPMSFTISRGGTTTGTASVRYTIAGSGANLAMADDFAGGRFPTGTVSFAANEISKQVLFRAAGDSRFEPDETFTVTLSDATGGTLDQATTLGTIWNDDSTFSIEAQNSVQREGNSGTTPFTFVVNRSGFVGRAATVDYVARGSGATPAQTSDLGGTTPRGTVSFAAGETSKTITINVTGNRIAEPDEGFTLTLNNPVGGSIVTATADGTILNDDTSVSIVATDANKLEGDGGEDPALGESGLQLTPFEFTVTRTGDVNVASSVDYFVSAEGHRPVDAADFGGTIRSGTLSFAAGEVSKTLTFNIVGDTEIESHESLTVNLNNSVGALLGVASASGTVLSEELPPVVAISDAGVSQFEGQGGSTSFEFTVTRTGNVDVVSSVDFLVDGNGDNPADADDFGGSLPGGTVNFAAGETSRTIVVAVGGDSQLESDEEFIVALFNEVLADFGTTALGESGLHSSALGAILNDDAAFSVAATSATNAEGSEGDTEFTFTVTRAGDLSGSSSVDFIVGWDSVPTAADAADFSGTVPNTNAVGTESQPTGTVTFDAGEATRIITVIVAGDTIAEADEGFAVTLSNPVGGEIQTASAAGSILDDDGTFSIEAASANKAEGHTGRTPFTFTITRTGSASVTSTVDYAVLGSGENPADGLDFGRRTVSALLPYGQLVFAPGETSRTLTFNLTSDSTLEADEGFSVTLSNPSGASVATASASGTILNDDAGLSIEALDAAKLEGHSGSQPFTFTVTRTGATSSAVTVSYDVRGSGLDLASSSDFGGTLPKGTVSFAAGETSKTITINVAGNKSYERDEGFTVNLSNASVGASLVNATADGVILNDDTGFEIAASEAVKFEGDPGIEEGDPALGESGLQTSGVQTTPFTFTVYRFGPLTGTSSVAYRVVGDGNRPADAADFGGTLPSGTLTFAPGEDFQEIVLDVRGDTEMESVEFFQVVLSNNVGGSIRIPSATGEILSEELPPVLSLASVNQYAYEGHSGNTLFDFTISRVGNVTVESSVDYVVVSSTDEWSSSAADFGGAFPTGRVVFAPGETSHTIQIPVSGDTQLENDEWFRVLLRNETMADLGLDLVNSSIVNDDAALQFMTHPDWMTQAERTGDDGTIYYFVVTRTGNLEVAGTVDYAVSGSGSHGVDADDFGGSLPSGTLTFAPGESIQEFTLLVSGDATSEADEEFTVTLSNSRTDVITTATETATILDNDGRFAITPLNANRVEGNSGEVPFTFTVTRTGGSSVESAVNFDWDDSEADLFDLEMNGGTITFAPGEESHILTVNVLGDTKIEPNENFAIRLYNEYNGTIETESATGTIISDDAGLSIEPLNANKPEGNSGTTPFTFTVTRSGGTLGTASVNYAVRGGENNPTATADFGGSFPRGTVRFAEGESSKTITINVTGNKSVEADEEFIVTLSNPVGASLITNVATGVIVNDDTTLAIAADNTGLPESASGETEYTFTISRTGDVNRTTSVNYTVAGNGAQPADGADFGGTLASGTVSFEADEMSKTIVVNVTGDLKIEPDETFAVTLSSAVGATIITTSATSTIVTDDFVPALGIYAVTGTELEGSDGTSTAIEFTVIRSGNLTESSSFDYAVNGSAVAGLTTEPLADAADFGGVLPSGTVSFDIGESVKTVVIIVTGDSDVESHELFEVALTNLVGATAEVSSATATIETDDTGLSITATNGELAEGSSGKTEFQFTVTRTGDIRSNSTFDYVVAGSSSDAADDDDTIGGWHSGTVTLFSGKTSITIPVSILGDTTSEPDEHFTVTLSNPDGAKILSSSADGTILDDDGSFEITADSASHNEANSGNTPFTFTVTRTGSSNVTSTVDFAVGSGGTDDADEFDFGGTLPGGTLTFAPGETSKTLTINVLGDTNIEPDEGFPVILSNPTAATINTAAATGAILNDDAGLSIAATDAIKTEGNTGSTPFTFTVTRTNSTLGAASVNYAVRGSGSNPTATADFGGLFPRGTLHFAEGETSKTITLNVTGNKSVEADEEFTVTLSNAVGASLVTDSATGTIVNDDTSVSIAATAAFQNEGQSGETPLTFTVTRSGLITGVTTVNYGLAGFFSGDPPDADNGDAADADDFLGGLATGSLTFEAGETSKTIVVNVVGDTTAEQHEGFNVTLSNVVGANLVTASANSVILDDESSVSIEAVDVSLNEGHSDSTRFRFTVTRTGGADIDSAVEVALSGSGTNAAAITDFRGGDSLGSFDAAVFPVYFLVGETSKPFTIVVQGDTSIESSEGFMLTVRNPLGTTLGTSTATFTILNDDAGLSIAAADALKREGNTGTTPFTFTVTRTDSTLGAASVDYTVRGSGSNPTATADFGGTFPRGTIHFADGETSKTITLNVTGNKSVEADEEFTVTLSNAVGASLVTATATGTILNDDTSLSIAATDANLSEGNSALGESGLQLTPFTFTVTRTGDLNLTTTVSYLVSASGTQPADAADFGGTFPSGTLSFEIGEATKTIVVNVLGDDDMEPDESFAMTLSNALGANIVTASATGVIRSEELL